MVRFIVAALACSGLIIVFLSRAENLFMLFLGSGFFLASLAALYLKGYAYYFLVPFVPVFAMALLTINSLSIIPNFFQADYIVEEDYEARLEYGLIELNEDSDYLVEGVDIRDIFVTGDSLLQVGENSSTERNNQFRLTFFNQSPLLTGSEFILADHYENEGEITSTWQWSRSKDLLALSQEVDYDYLQRLSTQLTDDQVDAIALQVVPHRTQHDLKLLVNGRNLPFTGKDDDRLLYRADIKAVDIWSIKVIEEHTEPPVSIGRLNSPVNSLDLIKAKPDPIIIDNFTLIKLFARLDLNLPFYSWDASAIYNDFNPVNAEMALKNDLLYLTPTGFNPGLEFAGSAEAIISEGLSAHRSYFIFAYIILTSLALFAYILVSLMFNNRLKGLFVNPKNSLASIRDSLAIENTHITGITPFKLFFFAFVIFFYALLLLPIESQVVRITFTAISLVLSVILIAYLIQDIRRVNK